MTDFDVSEIAAFKNTWPEIVPLICSFHAITGQNKWIDRNVPKARRDKLKSMFKELHFAGDEDDLKKKMANLKRYCTINRLKAVKRYLKQSWEPFVAMWVQFYRNDF